ncbi:MAG: penicillin-binding protein 2 [Alphaproteobacteria bacterium]
MTRSGPHRSRPPHPIPEIGGAAGLRLDGLAKQALETGRNRLVFAGALFALTFLVVGLRLIDVALFKEGHEPTLVRAPAAESLRMERADIVDRNGVVLATNLVTASLYAHPGKVLGAEEAAAALARALPELNQAEVRARLGSARAFVWLKRNLTPRQQYAVNRLGIPGLYFRREEKRFYPHGRLASHLVGFTDIDNVGLAGVERYFDDALRGASGPLRLSLDVRVQHILREELMRAVGEFQAVGAAGIVMNARTGEMLAMVSLPDFDPNRPALARDDARFNRAALGVYEMGSTFKIFTTAMALESGVVTLNDGYDATDPIRVARFVIRDFKPQRRWLSVPEIFFYSSNIGAAKMALAVGGAGQRAFLDRLGLLRAAPLELTEVGVPMVPSPWREISTMTIAYGHGLAVTPAQMAAAIAAVVNGGIAYPPTLVRHHDGDGPAGERVLSARTSEQMRRLLRLNVVKGTGRKAAVPGYLVGGKTGTAEKIVGRRYRRGVRLSSFVAAFPINEPRYVVVVLLDEPKGNESTHGYATGGWVAAPVVARAIARMAPLVGVEPINEDTPEIREAMLVNIKPRGRELASF